MAFAAEALKNDPGNLGLLKAALEAADILGQTVWKRRPQRAREAGLASRKYLETLMLLDPENRTWRFNYARGSGRCPHLRRDGRYAGARRVYAQIESLMLALRR